MAININHSSDRIDAPTIIINGRLIDEVAGTYSSAADQTISTQEITFENDNDVRVREALAFYGDVTVTITPDATWTSNTYTNRSSTDIVGATAPTISSVNQNAETYYTLNGKDPIRTKANLYTGAFTIKSNKFGSSDNIVIKARTYQGGRASEVRKVEIRISKENANQI